MSLVFDLISDIHVETWDQFDWTHQATSTICIIPGDVARDHQSLYTTLKHLAKNYQVVGYIDGNDEHKHNWNDITQNYKNIAQIISTIDNVIYLHNNMIISNGVAILGTNGWWNWNFDPNVDHEQSRAWFNDRTQCQHHVPNEIYSLALQDTQYLINSVKKIQTLPDVRKIVIITHTVPRSELLAHDIALASTYRFNIMGNSLMNQVLEHDTEKKITTWCFGHYHGQIDRVLDGVRYVNNCRGRGDTEHKQIAYFPLRLEINV